MSLPIRYQNDDIKVSLDLTDKNGDVINPSVFDNIKINFYNESNNISLGVYAITPTGTEETLELSGTTINAFIPQTVTTDAKKGVYRAIITFIAPNTDFPDNDKRNNSNTDIFQLIGTNEILNKCACTTTSTECGVYNATFEIDDGEQINVTVTLGQTTIISGGSGAVDSVFGRIGAIVATLGDYTSSLISNLSDVTGSTVTAALNALNTALGNKLETVATDSTITGDGTAGSPLSAVSGGSGDVTGPASSTNENISVFNGTTGKAIKDSGIGASNEVLSNVKALSFQTDEANPPHQEGLAFYDGAKKALSYYNEEPDVTVNLGQEVLFRVYNNTGSTITNGSVITNTSSGLTLADSKYKEKSNLIAVATHDIENASFGYTTRLGEVGGIDTSAFSAGDIVYLGSAGALTDTKPTDGGFVVIVGVVKTSDASDGIIQVNPRTSDHTVEIDDTNGFPSDQRTGTTISFVDGTRTFTIAPTGSMFHYYQLGEKYEKTSSESIVIDDTEGLHVIYYDAETLSKVANPNAGQVDGLIRNNALIGYVYWDATNSTGIYIGDERHGISMSPITHAYLHFTRGAQWLSGFTLGDFTTGGGTVDADAQFSVSSGFITDEDLLTVGSAVASTTGLPIFYKSGANGYWRKVTQAGFSVYNTGSVSGRLYYNEWTGTTWQLTEISANNNFVLCHVFATNDINTPTIAIMGEEQYANVVQARAGAQTEISNITTSGLPTAEFIPIATVIFKTNDGYANSINAYTELTDAGEDFVDWRTTELAQGSGASSHSNLTNLELAGTGVTWGHVNETLYDAIVANTSKTSYPGATATETLENKTIDFEDNTIKNFPEIIGFAASDEDTVLTSGTGKLTFRFFFAGTITGVRSNLKVAPTSQTFIADINVGGSSILSTKLSIDVGEKTSVTAATPPVISTTSVSDDAEGVIDFDQVGDDNTGAKFWIFGKRDL